MLGLLIPVRRSVKLEFVRREGGSDEEVGPEEDGLG